MCRLILTALLLVAALAARAAGPGPDDAAADNGSRARFVWGADFGSSIDLSAQDMSSVDFSASFGMRRTWIKFLGVGAAVNVMVSNSCRTYPVYAVLRTDFSSRMRLLFMDVRAGAAMNYLPDNVSQTGAYASLGVGVNLAVSRKFQSYIMAGYTFIDVRDVVSDGRVTPYDSRHMAVVRLGVSF